MAKAPPVKKGGHDAAAKRAEAARQTFKVWIGDEDEPDLEFEWQPNNIPTNVRAHVRDVTGTVVEVLIHGSKGMDPSVYCDMWWIKRLAAGETVDEPFPHRITREEVQREWDEKFPGIARDDISSRLVKHPEA